MSQRSQTIQQKIDELNKLVAWFDGDDFSLEQAIDQFNKAEQLANEIERDIASFKNDIVVLKQKFDG